MSKYILQQGEFGKRMVVCDEFTNQLAKIGAKEKILELELNWAKGFKGADLSFLENLNFLQSFEICDYNIKDISGIHYLTNLRQLSVSTYCKTAIDLGVFENLEDLSLFWRPKLSGLSQCRGMKKLFLYKYNPKDKDLSEISGLNNLQSLSLKIPTIYSLGDISGLTGLEELGIYGATKLSSIEGLSKLTRLKKLDLDCCKKIDDLSEIGRLENLESLSVSNAGKIKTLLPVAALRKLSVFNFVESTNVTDGNLEFLKRLPRLRKISYQNRPHYNVKREDIWKITEKFVSDTD